MSPLARDRWDKRGSRDGTWLAVFVSSLMGLMMGKASRPHLARPPGVVGSRPELLCWCSRSSGRPWLPAEKGRLFLEDPRSKDWSKALSGPQFGAVRNPYGFRTPRRRPLAWCQLTWRAHVRNIILLIHIPPPERERYMGGGSLRHGHSHQPTPTPRVQKLKPLGAVWKMWCSLIG